jgi:hypothetical protein
MSEDEFLWDYRYFKWLDLSVEVRRERIKRRNFLGQSAAAQLYRENTDGCRERWKENYRRRKLLRFNTDHLIESPDLELAQIHCQEAERYEAWLAKRTE